MKSVFPIDGQHAREAYQQEIELALRGLMLIEIYFTRRVIEVTVMVADGSEQTVKSLIEHAIQRVEAT